MTLRIEIIKNNAGLYAARKGDLGNSVGIDNYTFDELIDILKKWIQQEEG